ncbi:hypothetical protein ACJX0J_025750, partial [Zea mays]
KGIASVVLEKSETLRSDGAAIGVHANGWRALEQLASLFLSTIIAACLQRSRGVWKVTKKTTQAPIGKEFRCLRRKDLIETMAKNIPAGSIRFGCHVVAIQQDPGTHGPILTTVDGGTIRAKVLIGCDGGSSAVARYLGLSPPKAIPRTVLRGFTAYPHGHPFGAEFLRIRGGGEFVVGRLPVTRNLVHFFVTMPNPPTGIMLATKD